MKVSLVIPTYNREEFLVDTLKCALNQDFGSYEIIVVDQTIHHKPETVVFIYENKHRINYIISSIPSVTKARNIGVKTSKGDIIIMIDDDTLFESNFITEHWAAHQQGYEVVCGRIDEGKNKIAKQPPWLSKLFVTKGSYNCKNNGPTNITPGGNVSFRRNVYDTLNGFDENYYGTSICEDTDFGYRAYKAGFKMHFVVSASLFHRKAENGGVQNRAKYQKLDPSYYYCILYFIRKNLPVYTYFYWRIRLFSKALRTLIKMIKNVNREVKNNLTQQK